MASTAAQARHPLVSVVIPVYNSERYVASTLESVIAQSHQNLEIIIVIDGSTDRSHEICQQFRDERIRYVVQENQGLAAARNSGIREAKGEYIGFIDSDDTWQPEKVARHVGHFENDPELGLSYSYSALMDAEGVETGMYNVTGTSPTSFADCYVQNVIGNGSNALIRCEVFSGRDAHPDYAPQIGFDPELRHAEDYELWSRIALLTKWKMDCVPEPLVNYRINPVGLSSNVRLQRCYHLLALAKIAGYAPDQAEHLREPAVAHMYWHQARIHAGRKSPKQGTRAVRLALQYSWRTLNFNHALIAGAVTASLVFPKKIFSRLYKYSGHVFGAMQKRIVVDPQRVSTSPRANTRTVQAPSLVKAPSFYIRKGAMPNLFFLSHRHKFMYLGVSKNASTSMKQLMWYEENENSGEDAPSRFHLYWGFSPVEGRSVDVTDNQSLAEYRNYLRFSVYRDPVSRFLSAYHNKVLYSPTEHPFYTGKRLEGMGLEQFIRVAESILKISNPLHIDEHLRPQAWCYEPSDVDFIVPIGQLDEFLKLQFGIELIRNQNQTVLPRIQATERQKQKIAELYQCDYAIKPNWPPCPESASSQ